MGTGKLRELMGTGKLRPFARLLTTFRKAVRDNGAQNRSTASGGNRAGASARQAIASSVASLFPGRAIGVRSGRAHAYAAHGPRTSPVLLGG